MENIVAFFKSKLGKVVIAIVIIVIVYFVVAKQLEKRKFGGMTKEQLQKQLATDFALEKIEDIKKNDQNWINGGDKLWILNWYDENGNLTFTENQLKNKLSVYGVDYVKNPEVLTWGEQIKQHYNLVNTWNQIA